MKIGVISDTHDQIEQIKRVVSLLNKEQVALVIHCGDWVSPFSLYYYKDLKCPIHGIFGNNDGDKFRHITYAKRIALPVSYEDRFISTEFDGRKVAVFHGDYEEMVEALIRSQMYDAVFHGHNHTKEIKTVGKTLSINPGTFMNETSPDKKGASFALYDTVTNTGNLIEL